MQEPKRDPKYWAQAYKSACMAELETLKPGNVHIFADGHGMRVQDFMLSAEVSSAPITSLTASLGQRVLSSIQATQQAVGCNTNLGIVLLCAPLIQAAYATEGRAFNEQLDWVLEGLTLQDAIEVYDAIRLASPAGLGERAEHDVRQTPQCTLREAMMAASSHDMIAMQYADGFKAVKAGLAQYKTLLNRWERPAWAVTGVYLYFLTHHVDSHIARKYGQDKAKDIQHEAGGHFAAFMLCDNPKTYLPQLLAWDKDLKSRGINPGTSADLTVASLFMFKCV